jgi:hypothetical protein
MKPQIVWRRGFMLFLVLIIALPAMACAKEGVQQWELVNPSGVVQIEPINFGPRPTGLEGKTVVLRWNAKPNGDVLLNRVAEMLIQNVKNVKVIKAWEAIPQTRTISYGNAKSHALAKAVASLNPDLVIGAPGD